MKNILFVSLILGMTGCAIKPISNDQAKNIPLDRILDNSFFTKNLEKVPVVIKRDQGHVGSICTTQVLIDGHPIANLKMSEKIEIYLSAEQHIISSVPKGICGGGIAELQIDLSSKKPSIFRIGFDANATHRIQPTVF